MEASIYVNKIALPEIEAFAMSFGLEFTLGAEAMGGKFIELFISYLSESTVIAFVHAIGKIEGRAEERNWGK